MCDSKWIGGWLVVVLAAATGAAELQSIDLKPFVASNQFQVIDAAWLLPKGRQVVAGMSFEIAGVVELAGTSSRFASPGRTNVHGIPVGKAFERMYLLAAASRATDDGTEIAHIQLHYADGSKAKLSILYGHHLRDWFGPRHHEDQPLLDPQTRLVWQAQHPAAARRDDQIRLFQAVLTNPHPNKEVRVLDLESARARGGLMVAGITVGLAKFERGEDTLPKPASHTHPGSNDAQTVTMSGRLLSENTEVVANALVRVLAVRKPGTNEPAFIRDHPMTGRETTSDRQGNFELQNVSSSWLYRLLVIPNGFEPQVYDGADPLAGPLDIRVVRGKPNPQYYVHARLIGPDGKPVVGATVEPDGVGTEDGTSWGGRRGFPERAITGFNGEFVMGRTQAFTRLQLNIEAAGLAATKKLWLPASNAVQEVRMGMGSRLKGRVLKDDKPLAGLQIGVSGQDRNSEVYAGNYEATTDANGVFEFKQLPPDASWWLSGTMRSLKPYGSVRPRPVRTGDHESVTDAGDLHVMPGLSISGTVKTRNGEPVPKNMKIRASYDTAWDSASATVDKQGAFTLEGLHPGLIEVSIEASNWKLSPKNRSMDLYNPWWLTGLLEEDKHNLVLLIERGERDFRSMHVHNNGRLPSQDEPRTRPIRGVEPDGTTPIVLSGSVLDDETGKPIERFTVMPGRKPPSTPAPTGPQPFLKSLTQPLRKPITPWNELPFWYHFRAETVSNGSFSVEFEQMSSTPILRVEAEGYVAEQTEPIPYPTNLLVRLKRGAGPSAVVVSPDGRPASDAQVIFAAEREQYSLQKDATLYDYRQGKWLRKADKDGRFSFEARAQGRVVFIAHSSGWAKVAADECVGGKVRLQPWATMKGRLVTTNGAPVAGEMMALMMEHDWNAGDPFVNFQERPTTDAQGRFEFKRVPPGELQLHRLVPTTPGPSSGRTYKLQTPVYNKGGQTNDLGDVKLDSPPPPPIWKEWLKKLGL